MDAISDKNVLSSRQTPTNYKNKNKETELARGQYQWRGVESESER